jgi:hypothetical protein
MLLCYSFRVRFRAFALRLTLAGRGRFTSGRDELPCAVYRVGHSLSTAVAQTGDIVVQVVFEDDVVTSKFMCRDFLLTDCYFDEPLGTTNVFGGVLNAQTSTRRRCAARNELIFVGTCNSGGIHCGSSRTLSGFHRRSGSAGSTLRPANSV